MILLIASPFVLAQDPRLPLPTCRVQGKDRFVNYQSHSHFAEDFCRNDRGIHTSQECIKYLESSDQDSLNAEINSFLNKVADKVCGK